MVVGLLCTQTWRQGFLPWASWVAAGAWSLVCCPSYQARPATIIHIYQIRLLGTKGGGRTVPTRIPFEAGFVLAACAPLRTLSKLPSSTNSKRCCSSLSHLTLFFTLPASLSLPLSTSRARFVRRMGVS